MVSFFSSFVYAVGSNLSDDEFLLDILDDTYNYLIDMESIPGNGLPENWYNYPQTGSYCSPEEAGFYMLSHIGAYENGIISLQTAVQRINKTLNTLYVLPTYKTDADTIWQLGTDEAPPIYDGRAFDEFDVNSPYDPNFYVDSEPVNNFPKELNDWSTHNTYIYYGLSAAQAQIDQYLYLDTLYATHTGQDYFDLTVSVKKPGGSFVSIGTYRFGSGTSSYPESIWIKIPKDQSGQGQNVIYLKNSAGLYSGKWIVWDSLKLVGDLNNQGLFYRYYDTNTLVPTDQNIPSIGNAMLAASLITTRKWLDSKGYSDLSDSANYLVSIMNLGLFWDDSIKQFYHDLTHTGHWDFYSDEGRLLSFISFALNRISEQQFRDNLQALDKTTAYYDISTGATVLNPTASEDIKVEKISWDGSMFTYLVPSLFIQEHKTDYFVYTSSPAVKAQIEYSKNSNYKLNSTYVWGISDAFNASFYYCSAYQGTPPTKGAIYGNHYEDCPGLITPHASALALLTNHSQDAINNLKVLADYASLYDANYGFKDSINLLTNKQTNIILTLDQEWIFLSLMDKLNSTIWRYLYDDPMIIESHEIMYPNSLIINFSVDVDPGWQLISIPIRLYNKTLPFSSIKGNYSKIFTYSDGKWFELKDNDEVNESLGMWIKMINKDVLELAGIEITVPNLKINSTWSLISYPYLIEKYVNDLGFSNSTILTYHNNSWLSYNSNGVQNSLNVLTPGYGYWIKTI
ncbi:MAG: glucoamylase family protein [Nanoarchaeota archaeon]